jgi:hypothetical protein
VHLRTESPLLECHEGYHVSFHKSGECMILWHMASPELHRRHELMLHKFLQMVWHNSGRGPVMLRHGSGRKGSQCLRDPSISPISFFFSFSPLFDPSLFSDIGKEVRRESWIVRMEIGCRRATASFNLRSVDGKAVGPSQTQ